MGNLTGEQVAKLQKIMAIISRIDKENFVDKILEFSREVWKMRPFGECVVDGEFQTYCLGEIEIRWQSKGGTKTIQSHNVGIKMECGECGGYFVNIPYFIVGKPRAYKIPQRVWENEKCYTYVPLSMLCWGKDVQETVNSLKERIEAMLGGNTPCVYRWL